MVERMSSSGGASRPRSRKLVAMHAAMVAAESIRVPSQSKTRSRNRLGCHTRLLLKFASLPEADVLSSLEAASSPEAEVYLSLEVASPTSHEACSGVKAGSPAPHRARSSLKHTS